ncbi:MAG: DoxX family membrane protein, partial [Candidatus Dormibacterales bacterium]
MTWTRDVAALGLRLVLGGLLAGHGAQKLFGWFGGGGPEGTRRMVGAMGMEPPHRWAAAAGGAELGGGLLTLLGLAWPLGPVVTLAPMAMATGRAHRGRPIWASKGGAELPVTNMAVAGALALTGPGRVSADRLLRLRLPLPLRLAAAAATAAGVALALAGSRTPIPAPRERP